MLYIPEQFFNNKKNVDKVYDLLNEMPDTDILMGDDYEKQAEKIEQSLAEMGENKILEMFRNGDLA